MSKKAVSVQSMSGFGRASAGGKGFTISCEIKATNHRNLDLSTDLGEGLEFAEPEIRGILSGDMVRGRIEVRASLEAGAGGAPAKFNEASARWYGRKLAALAKSMGLPPPRVEALARLPGVLTGGSGALAAGQVAAALKKAVAAAAVKVKAMRAREGATLAADLGRRLGTLERGVEAMRSAWPAALEKSRGQLEERLKQALEKFAAEKGSATAKEIAALVERGDATEELTRLDSHLAQMRETLRAGGLAGRRLDFLVQEVNRELHTTGAKSPSAALSHQVVALKEEAERIREQVQNLL